MLSVIIVYILNDLRRKMAMVTLQFLKPTK